MKRLFLNVFLGFIILFSFVYLALHSISEITMHGESILVPDLRSFSISEVEDTLKTLKLRFSVVDSGAYNADYPRGSVIDHLPKYNSRVKQDREVYLTVNPKNISLISLPNYTDRSSRQYISELKAKGFRIGKFIYKNDEHANVVLGVRYHGEIVKINDKLEKASKVDLVLGNGRGMQIEMPNLIRRSALPARTISKREFLTPFDEIFNSMLGDMFPRLHEEFGSDFFLQGSYPKCNVINFDDLVGVYLINKFNFFFDL